MLHLLHLNRTNRCSIEQQLMWVLINKRANIALHQGSAISRLDVPLIISSQTKTHRRAVRRVHGYFGCVVTHYHQMQIEKELLIKAEAVIRLSTVTAYTINISLSQTLYILVPLSLQHWIHSSWWRISLVSNVIEIAKRKSSLTVLFLPLRIRSYGIVILGLAGTLITTIVAMYWWSLREHDIIN